MRCWDRNMRIRRGFTLIEVMAAVLVVAILVALLVPAVNLVKETALTMRQSAQFNAIEVGLEGYRNDFGDYPESYLLEGRNGYIMNPGFEYYCGAQRLAEAMLGRDGFGVHPDTEYLQDGTGDINGDGTINNDEYLYHVNDPNPVYGETQDENVAIRKGPYIDIEAGNPERLDSLYSPAELASANMGNAGATWVLCDQLGQVKKLTDNKRTGMPILYYKADPTKYMHSFADWDLTANNSNCMYNWIHNSVFSAPNPIPVLNRTPLPVISETSEKHPFHLIEAASDPGTYAKSFYDITANPTYVNPVRPYNPDRFILISAGLDGVYGTSDDLMNFDRE